MSLCSGFRAVVFVVSYIGSITHNTVYTELRFIQDLVKTGFTVLCHLVVIMFMKYYM
jgi:hypothetical protein